MQDYIVCFTSEDYGSMQTHCEDKHVAFQAENAERTKSIGSQIARQHSEIRAINVKIFPLSAALK